MAIKVEDAKKNLKVKERAPLTEEELKYVKLVEKFIDDEIVKQFEKSEEVRIFLYYANCYTHIVTGQKTDFATYRQEKMADEIENRFKAAGWKITYDLDDGLDGPNMSGADYMVLSPKRRR